MVMVVLEFLEKSSFSLPAGPGAKCMNHAYKNVLTPLYMQISKCIKILRGWGSTGTHLKHHVDHAGSLFSLTGKNDVMNGSRGDVLFNLINLIFI